MEKAYAYLRVSSSSQLDGDGFPRQRSAIRAYAESHGLSVSKWFEEKAISGTRELENRPALSDLMVALHKNGTRTVLIERLDRLARDLMVQESIIADFRKYRFTLVSVLEPDLLQDDPTRKLMRQFLGAIAEWEKSMIVAKLKAARDRIKARGQRCEGRKPYGHYKGEGRPLARMRELRAAGETFDAIAATLNSEGALTRGGAPWLAATVCKILRRVGA